jgi:hypothetical protein
MCVSVSHELADHIHDVDLDVDVMFRDCAQEKTLECASALLASAVGLY